MDKDFSGGVSLTGDISHVNSEAAVGVVSTEKYVVQTN